MKILFLLVCVGLHATCFAGEAKPEIPLLPSDAFGSLPNVSHVSLSPSGRKAVATILIDTPKVKGTSLQVIDMVSRKQKAVFFADNKKYDIGWTKWKSDSILLVGVAYSYFRNFIGTRDKTRETDLVVLYVEDETKHNIFSDNFVSRSNVLPNSRDHLVDILPNDADHVLMGYQRYSSMNVYRVNIHTQKARSITKRNDNVYRWITDRQHRARLLIKYEYTKKKDYILVKDLDSGKWKKLWSFKEYSKDYVNPLGFAADPNILYIQAYHNSLLAIFRVDLRNPDLKRELVYANDKYDVDGLLIYSKLDNDVVGISRSYGDGVIYFDSRYKELQSQIDKVLPDTENHIYSMSDNEKYYMVYSFSDIVPGFYQYGEREKGRLTTIAYRYNNLLSEHMVPTKQWNYMARDNKDIEGYLTMPRNSSQKQLPVVIFPHGGPLAYDDKRFNYWVQFFANRGYAVLQVNFRGSVGRGLEFRNEGLKTRKKAMQDIEDGVHELIKVGVADSERICIIGVSYGGYAALYGATKNPDLYTCAVSIAGLSDIDDTYRLNEEEELVKIKRDSKNLSPINFVNNVKIPILLIHGDQDRRVDIKQSIKMYKALKKAKKDVTFIELENEDHYLSDNENRKMTFREIEKFLKKHLPVEK